MMGGELSRLARRAFDQERSREILAAPPRKEGPGGLLYPFAADLSALAVCYHRTSARVLWDLYLSSQRRLEPLYEDLVELVSADQRDWLMDGLGISVLAFHPKAIEAGERQVVGVVKNALIEGAARQGKTLRLEPDRPDLTFAVRFATGPDGEDATSISIDLAGRPMHQRGYRTMAGEAPLREDLAANLVMLARHDGRREVLVDPLAGSGTLAIEAALLASARPVWMSGRRPSAHRIPSLGAAMERLKGPLFADSAPRIFASEIDESTYATMDRAIMTAGVSSQTTTYLGDFRDWDLARELEGGEGGLILSNPPYGVRVGGSPRELGRLYRDLGVWCRGFAGFRAGFIVGEPEADPSRRRGPSIVHLFEDEFGGRPRIKKPIKNGPLSAQFLLYDL